MIWSDGFANKLHSSFRRGPIPFLIVAGYTSAHQIFPRVRSIPGFWNYMVDGQRIIGFSTILTSVIVTAQNVFAGKDNFFVRDADIDRKSHNTRKWHC